MNGIYYIISLIVTVTGMLLSFKMGYRAAGREERLIMSAPSDMVIIDTEAEEKAPETDEKIREDMDMAIKMAQGYGDEAGQHL